MGSKVVRESNGRGWMDQSKVKYTHSAYTMSTHLNSNLNINNEKQDCKIGTVCGGVRREVLVGGWGRTKETKVMVYGRWTSYTYMKQN
jgi:hypothetical protein